MKKVIGIFLLALMCTQLLPIKEMGRLLFNNQIVEEHPSDGCSGDDVVKLAKDLKWLKLHDHTFAEPSLYLSSIHYTMMEEVPQGPAREIHCPPPNC